MVSEALLRIKVIADTAAAAAGLDKASARFGKFGSAMARAALPAAAVGGALVLGAKAAIDAASDYQQAQGAIAAVFGKHAGEVQKLSSDSAKRLGLAGSEYMNFAALIGGALQNAGYSTEQAVGKQDTLLGRAADLAATYGGTTADAVEAINAAIGRSEFDPLEKFNVSLNKTAINAELARRGQGNLTGAALKHAEAAAAMDLIMEKSSKTAGQFGREADTAAGRQQTAAAAATDAAAALGKSLLPAYTAVLELMTKFATWAAKNKTVVLVLAAVFGVLAVAVIAVNVALGIMALLASPVAAVVVAVVVAVVALGAAFVILYKKSTLFRNVVNFVWASVKRGAQVVARFLVTVFGATWRFVSAGAKVVASVIRTVFGKVRAGAAAVASVVKAIWRAVWTVIATTARTFGNVVKSVFANVRRGASTVASVVRSIWNAVWSAIRAGASRVGGAVASAFRSVKSVVSGAVDTVKTMVSWLGRIKVPGAVTGAFNAVTSAIRGAIDAVSDLIGWLSRIHVPKISLPSIGGLSVVTPAPAGYVTPGVHTTRGTGATSSAGGGVVVNVNGALDPDAVARQIKRLLAGHERRIGARA